MAMIVKNKVKETFHKNGVQIPISTLNLIDEEISRKISLWARRAKEGNIKRLKPEDLYLVLGNAWSKIID